uniref:Lipocalin-like domain-containing protein n=1 Tax=Roseihalotalea indica TaxID=2867963 RepID=A0AA49GUV2_9BACT|nr:hypothetical protein K4G66_12255 [Tunicatimonas sp. TK19036]
MFSRIFQNRYFSVCVLAALVFLASCKGDDNGGGNEPELTAQQERTRDMAGTWMSSEVLETPDDTEDAAMQELEALQMTFGVNQDELTPTTFGSEGAPTYFTVASGASATWSWANTSTLAEVNLTGVSPVSSFSITAFDGTTMTISFTFNGPSTSRVEGIGTYRVQLTKQ